MKKFYFEVNGEKMNVSALSTHQALNKIERLYGLILSRKSLTE